MKLSMLLIRKIALIALVFIPFITFSQPTMITVEGGTFKMGNPKADGKDLGDFDEKPVHTVKISTFEIGKYEVTVAEYKKFCKATGRKMPMKPDAEWLNSHPNTKKFYPNPAKQWWGWQSKFPMHNVLWDDAVEYCNWLSKKNGLEICYKKNSSDNWEYDNTKKGYRLPTEAEWEYAAKGGKNHNSFRYSGSNNPSEVGWYDDVTDLKSPKPVGTKKANSLGIHDMSGSVWEWCNDYYSQTFYKYSDGKTDPFNGKRTAYRVIRGGSWHYRKEYTTVTSRDGPQHSYTNYNYGFRLAKSK